MDTHDLTAAYALHALDEDERARYEEHLPRCERCREELAALTESAAALAWAVESPPPPPGLRGRILEAAAGGRENVVPLRRLRPWQGIAAVAACAAIGLGIWAGTLSQSLHHEQAARSAQARAMEIYVDPTSIRYTLRGGRGTLAVDAAGRAVLVVQRLRAAPSGKTYEAWVIPPGAKPIRAGLFGGGQRAAFVPLQQPVPAGSVVAATVERSGGVDTPTSEPVLSVRT
jgi:anti-sigma-K factor RskA